MRRSSSHYFPVAPLFILLGVVATVLLLILFELHIISFAYQKLGIPPRAVMVCLLCSLVGSAINIPVARLKARNIVAHRTVTFFGMRYQVPEVHQIDETILAVNLGGAIIPVGLSLYLIFTQSLFIPALMAIAIVTLAVHQIAFRVEGIGIAVPTLAPPLIALLTASFVAPAQPAAVAYIAGTIGTLIGADLMNLYDLEGLGAPIISIGGAGTADGIFLTGIIAVLLAP